MKKLVLIFSCLLVFIVAHSQRLHVVPYFNWSSKVAFMTSPGPTITGYGFYSDSLSREFNGKTFYEYAGEYFPIESWADYYYWYTQKYWYQFSDPGLYEYYYLVKDDFGMAQYICGNTFYGPMYPSRIALSFPGRSVYVNNLSRRNIRLCMKNDSWKNENYVASAEIVKRHDKKTMKPIVKDYKVPEQKKLNNTKREMTSVEYKNSRFKKSRINDVMSSENAKIQLFNKPNSADKLNKNVNGKTNTSRNSFYNNSSINKNRSASTNTNRSNIKRTTNTKQIRSSRTNKSR